MKVKITNMVMIGGERKRPGDVVEVAKPIAHDLIHRNKAVIYTEEIQSDFVKVAMSQDKKQVAELEELKKQADGLGIKYMFNISASTLKKKIDKHLEENAENPGQKDDISLEELKEMAREVEIIFDENIPPEELLEQITLELKQLAEEAEIEYNAETSAKELFGKIKEFLADSE